MADPDEHHRYLESDGEHRRGQILSIAAVVLLAVGAVVWQLGIPLLIVVGFLLLVFVGILLST